jgi:hypothetical protein
MIQAPGVHFIKTFLDQSRTAFTQIISHAFNGNRIEQKYAKIWRSVPKLSPKTCSKISAEMLVKQNNICCATYFMLASSCIVPMEHHTLEM